MAKIGINGMEIAYELYGEAGAPAVALTPGGRFPKDSPGLPELANQLAARGKRVLLWDRPNCGASDMRFEGVSESELHAQTLVKLIRELELGPTALAAGSAGSRVSAIAAARDPDNISHLILWWISGGAISLITLAAYYCGNSAIAASLGGMQAVAELPEWSQQIERNPNNRAILLAQEPSRFIALMEQWALAYLPSDETPIPGMQPADFAKLKMPVKIFCNGSSDLSHTAATTDWVHRLIPHSEIEDAPWPEDEWNSRMIASQKGGHLFTSWPMMADPIAEFMK